MAWDPAEVGSERPDLSIFEIFFVGVGAMLVFVNHSSSSCHLFTLPKKPFLAIKKKPCRHRRQIIARSMDETADEGRGKDFVELESDSDGVLAFSVCALLLLVLLVGGFYVWKYRKKLGFEDKR